MLAEGSGSNGSPPNLSPSFSSPSKFISPFVCRVAVGTVFLALLPFLPLQAPGFLYGSLHAESWEILQLVIVGIALSYGIFSSRSDDSENNNHYIPVVPELSSILDDEVGGFYELEDTNGKAQSWNSRTTASDPVVVIDPVAVEENLIPSNVGERSSCSLPIRSLIRLEQNSDDEESLRSPVPWRYRANKSPSREEPIAEAAEKKASNPLLRRPETNVGVEEEGRDVDRKAEEFIAKFRAQIRLQRVIVNT